MEKADNVEENIEEGKVEEEKKERKDEKPAIVGLTKMDVKEGQRLIRFGDIIERFRKLEDIFRSNGERFDKLDLYPYWIKIGCSCCVKLMCLPWMLLLVLAVFVVGWVKFGNQPILTRVEGITDKDTVKFPHVTICLDKSNLNEEMTALRDIIDNGVTFRPLSEYLSDVYAEELELYTFSITSNDPPYEANCVNIPSGSVELVGEKDYALLVGLEFEWEASAQIQPWANILVIPDELYPSDTDIEAWVNENYHSKGTLVAACSSNNYEFQEVIYQELGNDKENLTYSFSQNYIPEEIFYDDPVYSCTYQSQVRPLNANDMKSIEYKALSWQYPFTSVGSYWALLMTFYGIYATIHIWILMFVQNKAFGYKRKMERDGKSNFAEFEPLKPEEGEEEDKELEDFEVDSDEDDDRVEREVDSPSGDAESKE